MNCAKSAKARIRGFTLFEMLIAMGAGSLVFAAVGSMLMFSGKSTAALGNYVDLDWCSRNALDKMTTEMRQANRLTSFATNQLQFENVDVTTGATNTLTYTYNATAGTLTRSTGTQTDILLKGIVTNSLHFAIYQRCPVPETWDQYQLSNTTQVALCKVVQLSWICSRGILGRQANTESMLSAKVVIRKE
jgi:prepilin-type N-terminal cleavage/methylation domain-containing protein